MSDPSPVGPVGEQLIRRLVGRMQRLFYKGAPKGFYQELRTLRMAATWPATFIREYGTGAFDEKRYEAIFCEILRKVVEHGVKPDKMLCRAAYLAKAVQDHWRHNWDAYVHESKTAAGMAQGALKGLRKLPESEAAGSGAVAYMAGVHAALSTGRPRKAAAAKIPKGAREIQEELF